MPHGGLQKAPGVVSGIEPAEGTVPRRRGKSFGGARVDGSRTEPHHSVIRQNDETEILMTGTDDELCDDLPKVICFNEGKVAHLRDALPAKSVLEQEAERLKALAHPGRLAVLHVLDDDECCVCDLAHTLRQPVSTASQHLRRLHRAGLVTSRKEGKLVFYAVTDETRGLLNTFLGQRAAT